jgi:hypothetical protein
VSDDEVDEDRRDDMQRLVVDRTARLLDDVVEEIGPHPKLSMARAQLRAAWDIDGALEDLRLVLKKDPALLPARVSAARLVLALGDPEAAQAELAALMAPDGPLARLSEGVWRCSGCGRFDTEFFWRCDHCRQWGSAEFDSDRTQHTATRGSRERRMLARPPASRATASLPAPVEASSSGGPRRPSLVGRAGSWISGAWSGVRGRTPKRLPPHDDDSSRLSE